MGSGDTGVTPKGVGLQKPGSTNLTAVTVHASVITVYLSYRNSARVFLTFPPNRQ
jgi:hypothetical protein